MKRKSSSPGYVIVDLRTVPWRERVPQFTCFELLLCAIFASCLLEIWLEALKRWSSPEELLQYQRWASHMILLIFGSLACGK